MSTSSTLPVLGAAHVCARCAARGPTCCEPSDGVALAPLTPGDIRRIRRATGLEAEAFVTTRPIDDEEVAALEAEDPVLKGLVRDGQLRSLAQRGAACVFHQRDRGCTLAWGVRPLLCRRFPIVRDRGQFRVSPGGGCLAVEEAADLPELLEALGTDVRTLAEIDRAIRRDLRAPADS